MTDNEITIYEPIDKEKVKAQILEIRGYRVMLDSDIAMYFCVETKALNRAMKRNIKRFPEDFCFQLMREEYREILRCQSGTLELEQGKYSKLLLKHHETFWVKAQSEDRDGREYFRYDKVLHTKKPNASLLAPLIESGKITLDLAAHFEEDGKWRDHGMLFKMKPEDIKLLFGDPIEYDLETVSV